MQLLVSGKHLDVGDSLRGHVTQAIGASAERYFGRAIEGKVIFQRDRRAFRADISLHVARGINVQTHGEAEDPYAAFDMAAERLDKRLRRHKRRLVARRKEPAENDAPETGTHRVFATYSTTEAVNEPAEDRDHGAPAVVAEVAHDIPTLSVSDAVMCLDLGAMPVLMFRNRASGTYNVVYRRPDGTIGWIDPPAVGAAANR
ncbi:MAG: ribosome-associated translation inhibitor RaiA [Alphaproteobacteria bacterium]|nr:ribosome-associated translation inhibitor RaiA [Alphaproteobacteria bacterium]